MSPKKERKKRMRNTDRALFVHVNVFDSFRRTKSINVDEKKKPNVTKKTKAQAEENNKKANRKEQKNTHTHIHIQSKQTSMQRKTRRKKK